MQIEKFTRGLKSNSMKGVLMNILRYATAMEFLPFENVSSLRTIQVRWAKLPDVSWRAINAGYTPSEGDYDQVWESVFSLGGEILFDRVFDKIKNTIIDPKTDQINQKTKSMGFEFNDVLINGDHGLNPDSFEGLKKRVSLMPNRQTVTFTKNATDAPLDPTASVANARLFIDKFEELIYVTNRGQVNSIFMNEKMYYGFGRVLRYAQISGGNLLDVTKDSFEREVITYKGAPFIDIGLKKDQVTDIIPNDEVGGDSSATATSLYSCSYGIDEGVTGIQLSELEIYDPLSGGELESLPANMQRIEWWVGLANFGSYGIAAGKNILGPDKWS